MTLQELNQAQFGRSQKNHRDEELHLLTLLLKSPAAAETELQRIEDLTLGQAMDEAAAWMRKSDRDDSTTDAVRAGMLLNKAHRLFAFLTAETSDARVTQ